MRTPRDYDRNRDHHHCPAADAARRRRLPATGPAARRIRRGWRSPVLGAIAARTTRVRIGPACFASTPLRNALVLAYQWASLDFLSGGRTVFVACQGKPEPGGGAFEKEFAHFRDRALQQDAPHGG